MKSSEVVGDVPVHFQIVNLFQGFWDPWMKAKIQFLQDIRGGPEDLGCAVREERVDPNGTDKHSKE